MFWDTRFRQAMPFSSRLIHQEVDRKNQPESVNTKMRVQPSLYVLVHILRLGNEEPNILGQVTALKYPRQTKPTIGCTAVENFLQLGDRVMQTLLHCISSEKAENCSFEQSKVVHEQIGPSLTGTKYCVQI